jgi:ribosome-associated translation inhibitor RaiA
LATSIVITKEQPDLLERQLQIAFIERSKELLKDEKTHSDIRAALNQTNQNIERWLRKQKNASSETLKNHFRFAHAMLEEK